MWATAGRVLAVFAVWGVALALMLVAGAPPGRAEPLAAAGAGLSLLLWGARSARSARRVESARVPAEPPADRSRASV